MTVTRHQTLYLHTVDMLIKDTSCWRQRVTFCQLFAKHMLSEVRDTFDLITFWEIRYKHIQLTNIALNSCVRSSSLLNYISEFGVLGISM